MAAAGILSSSMVLPGTYHHHLHGTCYHHLLLTLWCWGHAIGNQPGNFEGIVGESGTVVEFWHPYDADRGGGDMAAIHLSIAADFVLSVRSDY